jgi:site-specific recombinase XerD
MTLSQMIDNYVAYKRSIGMLFMTEGKLLGAFSRAVGPIDSAGVDEPMVRAFLGRSGRISSAWHTNYYTLRGLFRFGVQRSLIASSPMPYFVPKRPAYGKPYIYSTDELRRLLDAASVLDVLPRNGQPPGVPAQTFRTLILLLYGAGLRLSEALSLTRAEVDLRGACLVIKNTKFFKTRMLPVGPKLASVLASYAERRIELCGRPTTEQAFFLSRHGGAVSRQRAEHYFSILRGRAGIARHDGAYFQPRLHDLRHSFAVHRLVAWYRAGADVQRLLPQLSTYLGHLGLSGTQHYLTMTPELLREAGGRFERYATLEVGHD